MLKQVIIAHPHGYCGGVSHAIETALKANRENPHRTYVLGDLVHNDHVVAWLQRQGVQTIQSLDEIEKPKGATLVIRAHGATPETFLGAKEIGLKIVDGTCPLVLQAHRKIKELKKKRKKVLYISSQPTHDEAIAAAAQAPEIVTLTTLKEINTVEIPHPENTVVVTQTTLSTLETKAALKRLKKKYPQLTIDPHICPATTQRQQAVIKLARKIGTVVIVGSAKSSNSNRLKEVAEVVDAHAHIVDTAKELNPSWFKGAQRVAVSSGASTPEWLLDEVVEKIKTF